MFGGSRVWLLAGLAVGFGGLGAEALAQSVPPPQGASYSFLCNSSIRSNYTETYDILSSSADKVSVKVFDGADTNSFEKPVHLLNTTLHNNQELFGRKSRFPSISSDFEELASLSVGTKVKAWATERRSSPSGKYDWSYTVSVVGTELPYVPDVGDLEVVTVTESRWVGLYSSNLTSQYSDRLKFPVYWSYKDSNQAEVECTLASASGVEGYTASLPSSTQSGQATLPSTSDTSSGSAASAAQNQGPIYTATQSVGVRREPNVAAPLVAMLPAGTNAQIVQEFTLGQDLWYLVNLPAGVNGYVPADPNLAGAEAAASGTTRQATQDDTSSANDGSADTRLARLTQLHSQGLISDEEFAAKKREIAGGGSQDNSIPAQLRAVNEAFRTGSLSAEAFVAKRATILAEVSPEKMAIEDGLGLIDQLLAEQLISPTEHKRKRSQMLQAL